MRRPAKNLPSQYSWRRWQAHDIRFYKPGDPSPDAEIWLLELDSHEIAKITALGNGQWLVTVNAWCRPEDQKHAVADSEGRARHWCERWAERSHEVLKRRFPLAYQHPNGQPR